MGPWFVFFFGLGIVPTILVAVIYGIKMGLVLNFSFIYFLNYFTGYQAISKREFLLMLIIAFALLLINYGLRYLYRSKYGMIPLKEMIIGGSSLALTASTFAGPVLGGILFGGIVGIALIRRAKYFSPLALFLMMIIKIIPAQIYIIINLLFLWKALT